MQVRRRVDSTAKRMLWSVLVAVCSFVGTAWLPGLAAQTDSPTFTVVSIRESPASRGARLGRVLPGGRWRATAMTTRDLIRNAYAGEGLVMNEQVIGGPDWLDRDRFDIEATTDASIESAPDANDRLDRMLQALLRERFHLKTRNETQALEVFEMVLERPGRLGPRLKPSACRLDGQPREAERAPCEPLRTGRGVLEVAGMTMPELAAALSNFPVVARPVHDLTGLKGAYDFRLEFVGQVTLQGAPNPNADAGPGLFTALREQLGLVLQTERRSVRVVIIEHVERPTAN